MKYLIKNRSSLLNFANYQRQFLLHNNVYTNYSWNLNIGSYFKKFNIRKRFWTYKIYHFSESYKFLFCLNLVIKKYICMSAIRRNARACRRVNWNFKQSWMSRAKKSCICTFYEFITHSIWIEILRLIKSRKTYIT